MNASQISPQDALATLDNTLASVNTNRQGHAVLQQCIATLQAEIATGQERASRIAALEGERDEWKAKAETLKGELQALNVLQSGQGAGESEPAPVS